MIYEFYVPEWLQLCMDAFWMSAKTGVAHSVQHPKFFKLACVFTEMEIFVTFVNWATVYSDLVVMIFFHVFTDDSFN